MLTASDDDFDHVAALEIGADDFVTKPIKPRVLLARMRMLLRRVDNEPIQTAKTVLEFGALSLNQSRHLCEMNGEAVAMTDSEFDLLWLLASTPDQVLSRDVLTKALRGIEYDGLDRTSITRLSFCVKNSVMILPHRNALLRSEGKDTFLYQTRGNDHVF